MTSLIASLSNLRRPQTLMRAARFGLRDYSRERDLKRLIKKQNAPRPAKAIQELMALETVLEDTRQAGEAAYSVARHIEVLAAIMAETRLLPEFMQLDRVG